MENAGDAASGGVESEGLEIEDRTEDFKDIVESDAFIDKTLLIKQFVRQTKFGSKWSKVLITAPAKFGKSVNTSMLKRFFDIQETPNDNLKLFKNNNLKVYQCLCVPGHTYDLIDGDLCPSCQFFNQHCGQYPVISVSFQQVHFDTWEEFMNTLKEALNRTFLMHEYLVKYLTDHEKECFLQFTDRMKYPNLSEYAIRMGLSTLAAMLYKHFQKGVIILMEDIDAHLEKLGLLGGLSHLVKVADFIGMMISSVMKGNDHVLGGLITAHTFLATTFLQHADNVEICPFLEHHRFADFFGFTQEEVDTLLSKPQFKNFPDKAVLDFYSGYRVLGKGTSLYNPFSIVKYLHDWNEKKTQKHREAKRYWAVNHGISHIEKTIAFITIENLDEIMSDGLTVIHKAVYRTSSEHVYDLRTLLSTTYSKDVWSKAKKLLYLYLKDCGYFNVIQKEDQFCILQRILNGEMGQTMFNLLRAKYLEMKYPMYINAIKSYCTSLNSLNGNLEVALQGFVNSLPQLFSGCDLSDSKNDLKDVLFNLSKDHILCESLESGLLIYRKDGTAIIVEVNKDSYYGLEKIFKDQHYRAFEFYPDAKQKIYIGLSYNEGQFTAHAFSASAEEGVQMLDDCRDKVVMKTSQVSNSNYRY